MKKNLSRICSKLLVSKAVSRRTKKWLLNTVEMAVLGAVMALALGAIGSHKALAYNPGTDIPNTYKQQILNYDNNPSSSCLTANREEWFNNWISPQGNPSSTTIYMNANDTTSLQINSLIFLCHTITNVNSTTYPNLPNDGTPIPGKAPNPGYANYTYIKSIGASAGNIINPPIGNTITASYQGSTRYWPGNPLSFTYSDAGLSPGKSYNITINATTIPVNYWGDSVDRSQCVGPGQQLFVGNGSKGRPGFTNTPDVFNPPGTSNMYDGSACSTAPASLSFTLVVSSAPPAITGSCSLGTISGTDNNYGSDSHPVTITVSTGGANGNGTPWTQDNIVGTAAMPDGKGYWLVGSDGGIFAYGDAAYHGSRYQINPGLPPGGSNSFTPNGSIVGMVATADGGGYWMVSSGGGVYAFGDAPFYGSSPSLATVYGEAIVGMARTVSGNGYWLVSNYGRVWAYGDARAGSEGEGTLIVPGRAGPQPTWGGNNEPWIVGMATNYTNNGIWLVSYQGDTYAYGTNNYGGNGQGGVNVVAPVTSIAATPNGGGYWLVNQYGQVYAFGDATPSINTPGLGSSQYIKGIASTPDGKGYWLAGKDGGVFAYGDAGFYGSNQPTPLGSTIADPNYTYNVTQFLNPSQATTFSVTAKASDGQTYGPIQVTCPPAGSTTVIFTCGSSSVNPGTPTAGQQFSITSSVNYTSLYGGAGNVAGTIYVKLSNGTQKSFNVSGSSPLSGKVTESVATAGQYSYSWRFVPSSPSSGYVNNANNCGGPFSTTFNVVYKPYMNVSGGDVIAGSGFGQAGATCTDSSKSGVIGWNQDNAPAYSGSGTPFAVYALGDIEGFASGQGTNTNSGAGLSFTNTTNVSPTNDKFGGQFDTAPCAYDYWNNKPSVGSMMSFNGSLGGLKTDNYYSANSVTISGGTIGKGVEATIYVNGNVYITGDIKYADSNSWSSFTDIPRLIIVASGNINIHQNVSELDGTYVAEPTSGNPGNTGIIATCADSNGNFLNYNPCTRQLNVYGQFIASRIKYMRTYGNLYAGATPPNAPAEQFFYSPEDWLAGAASGSIGTPSVKVVHDTPPPPPSTPSPTIDGVYANTGCSGSWGSAAEAIIATRITSFYSTKVTLQISGTNGYSYSTNYYASALQRQHNTTLSNLSTATYNVTAKEGSSFFGVGGKTYTTSFNIPASYCSPTHTVTVNGPSNITPILAPCEDGQKVCYDSITSLPPIL